MEGILSGNYRLVDARLVWKCAKCDVLKRNFERALSRLQDYISRPPKRHGRLHHGGLLCERAGAFRGGTRFLEPALQLEPTSAYAHSEIASVQMHEERFAEAAGSVAGAFQLNPKPQDRERWLSTMGYIHSKKGDSKAAADSYSAAARIDPGADQFRSWPALTAILRGTTK